MIRTTVTAITLLVTSIFVYAQTPLNRYELDIDDFTQLKIASPINVNYVCNPDSAGKVVFNTTPEMASVISFANNKKKLTVEFTTKGVKYTDVPTVTVYSNYLTIAENQADSLLRIVKVASGPEIKLRLMGNGRIAATNLSFNEISASITTGKGSIAVSGKCKVANLTSYSVGNIQADNLQAEIVKCKLLGTGEIGCWPTEELNVSLSGGSGTIYYRGLPAKIKNRSVNIKLVPIKEE